MGYQQFHYVFRESFRNGMDTCAADNDSHWFSQFHSAFSVNERVCRAMKLAFNMIFTCEWKQRPVAERHGGHDKTMSRTFSFMVSSFLSTVIMGFSLADFHHPNELSHVDCIPLNVMLFNLLHSGPKKKILPNRCSTNPLKIIRSPRVSYPPGTYPAVSISAFTSGKLQRPISVSFQRQQPSLVCTRIISV